MIFLVFKHTATIIIIIILNYRCYTQADILPIFSLLISKLKVLFFFFLPLCLEGSRTCCTRRSWATKQTLDETRWKCLHCSLLLLLLTVNERLITANHQTDRQSAIGDWSRGIDWSVCLPELYFSCPLLLVLLFALRMMMRCSMMWFCCRFCGGCGDHYLTVFQLSKSNLDDLDIPCSSFDWFFLMWFAFTVCFGWKGANSLPFFEFLSY